MNSEKRRKHTRIAPKKKAFASIGSNFFGICKIEDISMGGVGIECVSEIKSNGSTSEVTLYLPKDEIESSSLPCKIIYKVADSLPSHKAKGEALFKRFRFGIAFENLNESQRNTLAIFLEALRP